MDVVLLGLIKPAPKPNDLRGSDQILSILAGLRLAACRGRPGPGAVVPERRPGGSIYRP
jgi:hypothetical protein